MQKAKLPFFTFDEENKKYVIDKDQVISQWDEGFGIQHHDSILNHAPELKAMGLSIKISQDQMWEIVRELKLIKPYSNWTSPPKPKEEQ